MARLSSLTRMRVAIGGTVAALVVAGVLVATSSDDGPVRLAAEVGTSTTSTTELAPSTTIAPTTPLPVDVSTTVPAIIPKTSTTRRAPATTTTAVRAGSGSRCGTPTGNMDLGASRSTTTGSVTTTIEVFPCEVYDGEHLVVHLIIKDRTSVLRDAHLTYGDGTGGQKGIHHWVCDDPNKPDPYYLSASPHSYAAPGAYTLTGTVTTASCADWAESRQEGPRQTSKASITVYRMAGKRPPSS